MTSAFIVLYMAHTHTQKICMCMRFSTAIWDLDKLTFRLSHPSAIFFPYLGYDGIFIYHLMHLHFKSCQHCFFYFFIWLCMLSRQKRFSSFCTLHKFIVMYLYCSYFNWNVHFYFPLFFLQVIYVFNVDSLCANVYNNSKYHCALFLKRFEFVSIMTIDAFEISKVFFFYNEKIVREREREDKQIKMESIFRCCCWSHIRRLIYKSNLIVQSIFIGKISFAYYAPFQFQYYKFAFGCWSSDLEKQKL